MEAIDPLDRMVQEREIERLLVRYCRLVDDGHTAEVSELFEPDGRLDLMGRKVLGRDAIAQVFAEGGGPVERPSSSHVLSNMEIELTGNTARAVTDLTVVGRLADGSSAITLVARYHDELRLSDRWRFVSRRVVVHAKSPR